MAFVPFAAGSPYELWLVPRRHAASFRIDEPGEIEALAGLIGRSLRRVSRLLGAVPYSYVIESAGSRDAHAPHLHWRLPSPSRRARIQAAGRGFNLWAMEIGTAPGLKNPHRRKMAGG